MINLNAVLFALAKNHDGFYRSERQRKYLLDLTKGCHKSASRASYGEFNGRERRSVREVFWTFYLDDQGVSQIIKEAKDGKQSIYFERTREFLDARKALRG